MSWQLRRFLPLLFLALSPTALSGQQVADSAWAPRIERPAFAPGAGPLVVVDGGHQNFHTADGRYLPFATLLRQDGWRVEGRSAPFTRESLADVRVLVIANALAAENAETSPLPTRSAFSPSEIDAVVAWVHAGGSLLLVADHMPFAGAADSLARRLGFEMRNGFAGTPGEPTRRFVFRRADGSLHPEALAHDDGGAAIDSVRSFTGQAFRALHADIRPLLILPDDALSFEPTVAFEFSDTTPTFPVGGWLQAATRELGSGRVAVFGEAAMLTAQLAGAQRVRMGMNSPLAPQNYLLVLETLRWLGRSASATPAR